MSFAKFSHVPSSSNRQLNIDHKTVAAARLKVYLFLNTCQKHTCTLYSVLIFQEHGKTVYLIGDATDDIKIYAIYIITHSLSSKTVINRRSPALHDSMNGTHPLLTIPRSNVVEVLCDAFCQDDSKLDFLPAWRPGIHSQSTRAFGIK